MTSSIWRPSQVGAPGTKEISIHNYEELAALHAIARILAQPGELREQLEQALQEMSDRLGMQRGMISLMDRETGEVWLDVAHGVDIQGLDVTYQPGEGITGKVAQTGRPMACANLGQEAHFLDRTGARRFLNRSELTFLCVPIIYDGRVVGVLSADKVPRQVENLDRELALLSSVAELLAKAVHSRAVEEENRRLRQIVGRSRTPSADIIGHSSVMQDVFGLIAQVADSNTTVLIHGETGTGKELVARAIHKNSPRLKGPLVQVNCAAIPDTLIESELFGHERGAFTGALHQRRGRFEEANGGTIFLDEVGELSAAAQAKLLRVLQEKQFQPLGSSRVVSVDVRVIAATNRNLEQDLAIGTVPRRPLLPAERLSPLPAAAARPGKRHPPARRPFRPEIYEGDGETGRRRSPRRYRTSCWPTTGRETSGNWRTASNGRFSSPRGTRSRRSICRPPSSSG